MSCQMMSCQMMSCRMTSCQTISCHFCSSCHFYHGVHDGDLHACHGDRMKRCWMKRCRMMSCRMMSCQMMSCRMTSCQTISCHFCPSCHFYHDAHDGDLHACHGDLHDSMNHDDS